MVSKGYMTGFWIRSRRKSGTYGAVNRRPSAWPSICFSGDQPVKDLLSLTLLSGEPCMTASYFQGQLTGAGESLSSPFQAHFWSPNTTPKADPPFLPFSRSPALYPAVLKALAGIFRDIPAFLTELFKAPPTSSEPFKAL